MLRQITKNRHGEILQRTVVTVQKNDGLTGAAHHKMELYTIRYYELICKIHVCKCRWICPAGSELTQQTENERK